MFKLLGIAVAVYTIDAARRGRVFARAGIWGRTVTREASPEYFWVIIAVYALLALALLLVF